MKVFKWWVLVGGTGRNIGKTTLAELLIDHLSNFGPVIGIKISNIKPDGMKFHGTHQVKSDENFYISEETNISGSKDSMRFLKAGAEKAFFIQTSDEFIQEAFQRMLQKLKGNEIVVCETNSLRNVMVPAVFFMIKGEGNHPSKGYVEKFFKMADYVVKSMDLKQFEKLSKSLVIKDNRIKLSGDEQ